MRGRSGPSPPDRVSVRDAYALTGILHGKTVHRGCSRKQAVVSTVTERSIGRGLHEVDDRIGPEVGADRLVTWPVHHIAETRV